MHMNVFQLLFAEEQQVLFSFLGGGSPLDVMACPHLGETQRKIKTLIEIITDSVRIKALSVEIRGTRLGLGL